MAGGEREKRFRSALSHRDYRLLLSSLAISDTGNWLYAAATIIYILDATGSAAWVGAAAVVRLLPYILFEPLGGAIADKYDRRKLMIVLDVARAGVMCVMAVVAISDARLAVVAVIALTFVNNVFTAPYYPAVTAVTPSIVPERDLAAANALSGTIDNFALAFGPALGRDPVDARSRPGRDRGQRPHVPGLGLPGLTDGRARQGRRGRSRVVAVQADRVGRQGDPWFEGGDPADRPRGGVRVHVRPGGGVVRSDRGTVAGSGLRRHRVAVRGARGRRHRRGRAGGEAREPLAHRRDPHARDVRGGHPPHDACVHPCACGGVPAADPGRRRGDHRRRRHDDDLAARRAQRPRGKRVRHPGCRRGHRHGHGVVGRADHDRAVRPLGRDRDRRRGVARP